MPHVRRTYRTLFRAEDLAHFQVKVKETDLCVGVRTERFSPELVWLVEKTVKEERSRLEAYIEKDPVFLQSLEPHHLLAGAPQMAVSMAEASRAAGVGPMAAVAGAFADMVGRLLARYSRDVVVENGGDIYLKTTRKRTIGIFAGDSPLSNRVAVEVLPGQSPLGICTSSATVGHSVSFGRADAAVVLAQTATLADAVATAACNLVQTAADIEKALAFAQAISGVTGAVVVFGERIGAWGNVKLVPLDPGLKDK
ncbi:MAG: UPF0280 family protein [Ammonifex sp.]|nr:MAG: UPF0280 family protein [Ammonifex sp.]